MNKKIMVFEIISLFYFLFFTSCKNLTVHRYAHYKALGVPDLCLRVGIKSPHFVEPQIMFLEIVAMSFKDEQSAPTSETTMIKLQAVKEKCPSNYVQKVNVKLYSKTYLYYMLKASKNGRPFDQFRIDVIGEYKHNLPVQLLSFHDNLVLNIKIRPGKRMEMYPTVDDDHPEEALQTFNQGSCIFLYSPFDSKSFSLSQIDENVARFLFLTREIKLDTWVDYPMILQITYTVWPYQCQNQQNSIFKVSPYIYQYDGGHLNFYFEGLWNNSILKRPCYRTEDENICDDVVPLGYEWNINTEFLKQNDNRKLTTDEIYSVGIITPETYVCNLKGWNQLLTRLSYQDETRYYSYVPYPSKKTANLREWKPLTKNEFERVVWSPITRKCMKV